MRSRTRMEKEVARLSEELPPLTEEQRKHAFRHCFNHCAIRSKSGTLTCSECGHSWQGESELIDRLTEQVCPRCGEKLEVMSTRKRKFHDKEYYSVITVRQGYQVIRYFLVERRTWLGHPTEYSVWEVVQRWIAPNGTSVTLARRRVSSALYYDLWASSSPLEIRSCQELPAYDIGTTVTWKYRAVLPEIRRNGYNGNLHRISPYNFFKAILASPHAETLLKAGQIPLFRHYADGSDYSRNRIDRYWSSIRIAIRNGYLVKDTITWKDYIEMLESFGKDIRNPKYVCPDNLQAEHDRLVEKRSQERARMERAKKEQDMRKFEKIYQQKKGRYFGLAFTDGLISVHVLSSVAEFCQEGKSMHHCVFENDYFLKDDSLILSATIEGERIETVEVSLQQLQVVQSRGKYNSNTEYHDRIIELVNNNLYKIRQLA